MKKVLRLIADVSVLLTVCFIISGSVFAAEDINDEQFSGFGVSAGFGQAYGGIGGCALEYYMPLKGYHI